MSSSAFRVRVASCPFVEDEARRSVSGVVIDIRFPGEIIETPTEKLEVIPGLGVTKILVDDQVIRGVPLC